MLLSETGLTCKQIAQLLLVSESEVVAWEQGTKYPDVKHRKRIEHILGEKIDWDLDTPYSDKERRAIMSLFEELYSNVHDFNQVLIFGLINPRQNMRQYARDFGYLQ